MRVTLVVFGAAACLSLVAMDAALAAPKCQTTIPKEWNQPRVTYTYSGQSYASGYSSRAESSRHATSYSARSYRTSYDSRSRW